MILRKHFYCTNCNSLTENTDYNINNDESIETEEIVENTESCDCDAKKDYFIEGSLHRQLQSLYQRPNFYNKLIHMDRFSNNGNDDLKDIYSGSIYQELTNANKILSNQNNISFMWYTDGIKIFRSSKFNVWGFFLIILELPYEERYKLENILLAGL